MDSSKWRWRSWGANQRVTLTSTIACLLMIVDMLFTTMTTYLMKTAVRARYSSLPGEITAAFFNHKDYSSLTLLDFQVTRDRKGQNQDALCKFKRQIQEGVGWHSGWVASNWSQWDEHGHLQGKGLLNFFSIFFILRILFSWTFLMSTEATFILYFRWLFEFIITVKFEMFWQDIHLSSAYSMLRCLM